MNRIVLRNTMSTISALMVCFACAVPTELINYAKDTKSNARPIMPAEVDKKKSAEKKAESNREKNVQDGAVESTEQIVESIENNLKANSSDGNGSESRNPKQAPTEVATAAPSGSETTPPPVTKTETKQAEVQVAATSGKPEVTVNPNRFNRLLERRGAQSEELLDPNNPSLKYLQKPDEAFADLPKEKTGNKVDWVKAVETGKINPRHDLNDPNIKPMVMDMNIVMQVKGSMPDVVFPHKAHTRWLDCSNCHPAIFIPQSGANKMSMADNLLGKRCGLCHGKVAFPLSACTKCHSNKKVVVKEKK